MTRRQILLRVTALAVLAWLVWDGSSTLRRQTVRVRQLEDRVRLLEARQAQVMEVRRSPFTLPGADALDGKGRREGTQPRADGRRGTRPAPGARARKSTEGMPGANLLNRLYDAADELAVQEQWDPETYDAASRVFEQTATDVTKLYEDFASGKTSAAEARRAAVKVRDVAQQDLAGILGPDGLARLKRVMGED